MTSADSFRQYARECVAQAEAQKTPADRNILLNMALAWVRLAQQTQTIGPQPDGEAEAKPAGDTTH